MYKIIKRIFIAIYNRIIIIYNPALYAKRVGVKMGTGVKFYAARPGMFGSEPWMITLGDDVHITAGVNFITHDGGVLVLRKKYPKLEITKPIIIQNNVFIGINSIILPGVKVGNNVVIGSGSIVSKDIPDNVVVAGVPAKIIKTLDEYLHKTSSESLGFGNLDASSKEKAIKQFYGL